MAEFGIDYVDVLKIDIEGAEREVFKTCSPWIKKVGTIVIELHDRFVPGCTDCFREATADFPFHRERGELTIVAREGVVRNDMPHHEHPSIPQLPCRIIGRV